MTLRGFLFLIAAALPLLLVPPREPERILSQEDIAERFRREEGLRLSPYDALIRASADSIGWDWRLVAAMIYHESRFNSEAHSDKGATGLLQIHSSRYEEDTLLDPETNLAIGTRYLKKLGRMFEAATPLDTLKFALAAYNLGDGNVKRLRARTLASGEDATRWEIVSRQLPAGHHTTAYVRNVLHTYDEYRRKYPR